MLPGPHTMNTRRLTSLTTVQSFLVLMIGFHAGSDAHAALADTVGDVCETPSRHFAFIENSLQLVREGRPKAEVLDALRCIWFRSDVSPTIRLGAMHAYLHISGDDAVNRNTLLDMLDLTMKRDGSYEYGICMYLMYIETPTVRDRLMAVLEEHGTRCSGAHTALLELGEPRLREWLESRLVAVERDKTIGETMLRGYKEYLREQMTYLDSQQSLEKLLAFFASGRQFVTDNQIEKSLVRRGCTREQLRACYIQKLKSFDEESKYLNATRSYISFLVHRGVLRKEDLAELPPSLRELQPYYEDDIDVTPRWPRWAKYMDSKEAKFWDPDDIMHD